MGRKKIQIKPITDEKIRKVTFNRRRNGILKKAYELSILCDTEVVVLMFDHKEMCHVYSSEEGANSHARLMGKYITKDFCTVDPIRNYDTSPDLQLDDPSQAVWRQSKEKVAVVNTYTVLPSTGIPHLASSKGHADDDDDDEADGSEQLAVKSSRTYHTKPSDAKFGQQMNTPALTDKAHSPTDRSVSPDLRNGQLSPRRSPAQPKRGQQQQQQQPLYPAQSGLGISGSGYTPLLRPGEQFTPILYPPQPPPQARYTIWPSPEMVTDQCGMTQQLAPRQHLLPNMGIQYANQQLQSQVQYQHYDAFTEEFVPSPIVPQPLMRQSPRKEQAHFNHYTYPRPQNAQYYQPEPYDTQPLYQTQFPTTPAEGTRPVQFVHTQSGPQIADRDADEPSDANEKYLKVPTAEKPTKKTTRKVQTSDHQRNNTCKVSETAHDDAEAPRLQVSSYELEEVQVPLPERRITRSQSRSPQMKARQLPARLAVPMSRKQVPVHLRGPSLIDDITFDPETGAPMMESAALADWLGSTPIHGASPGHSRETSHVRGESVSQWLNLPPAIPE